MKLSAFSRLLVFVINLSVLVSCSESDPGDMDSSNSILTVSFEQASSDVEESASSIFIPLKLEGSSDEPVFVSYEVSGTADFPIDVTPLTNTTFLIPAGAKAFNIEMLVLEDNVTELAPEHLDITLISASDGGELGTQITHRLNISEDDVVVVGFAEDETITGLQDLQLEIVLSKPGESELNIQLSSSIRSIINNEDLFFLDEEEITIPSGQSSYLLDLPYNDYYDGKNYFGDAGSIRIAEISGLDNAILNADADFLRHEITIVEAGSLEVEMTWVSSNSDVDLDLLLFDSGNEVVLSSTADGPETGEVMTLTDQLPDGVYKLVVHWFAGSGSADITMRVTPKGSATWLGVGSQEIVTFKDYSEEDNTKGNVFGTITKNGYAYD